MRFIICSVSSNLVVVFDLFFGSCWHDEGIEEGVVEEEEEDGTDRGSFRLPLLPRI